ncbi:MAG: diacylglycerol kinase family lipid kinase [Rhizobiaceae bacterium]|nr:diacylglycerol kinase family lipid kinase [Rhizobiaceae bacterium]
MRFRVVLNQDGGSLRTLDLNAFSRRIEDELSKHGHQTSVEIVAGKRVQSALQKAAKSDDVDIVMAGGGDGTISAAAGALMGSDKALAVLPAGTMNLFARSLKIPLTLDKAIVEFATGKITAVDVATANGQPFVHQFSLGMHAKMVRLRSKMEFGSRWGKIGASAKAAYATIMSPPQMKVELQLGETDLLVRTTGIGVTNNLFGEGTLPYAENPAGGTLGIYVTVARERGEILRFFANLARGKWRDNDQVEIHEADKVRITIKSGRFLKHCVLDGELLPVSRDTTIEIHPKTLKVLVPAASV